MDQLRKFEIIHLYHYEHDTIDEIVKYFEGKVSKYDINNVLNIDSDEQLNIIYSHIQLMTAQLETAN